MPDVSATLARIAALGRDEMRSLQLRKLRRQMERLVTTSAFYRDRWTTAGVTPDDIRSVDDLRRIPTIGKSDCLADQTAHPPYGTRLGIRPEEVALVCMTGGTSGQGQEIYGRSHADVALQSTLR